jgi:hypothetical protein
MQCNIKWTNLNCVQISELMKIYSIDVGVYVVKQLFKTCGYVKRKMTKCKTMKDTKDRNIQFEYIAALKEEFLSQNNPILSIDSKKKELIGDFFRDGGSYSKGPIKVNDHDFKSFSDGEITPHGIYDIKNNKCYLTIGTSKDTAEFVADNIEYHWGDSISHDYPGCEKILILCDGGGSNNCRHYVVKEQFYGLANKLGVEIVMAHYPAYCSK